MILEIHVPHQPIPHGMYAVRPKRERGNGNLNIVITKETNTTIVRECAQEVIKQP